ncbi:hypothetical protein CFN78_16450 [Amycolatopsis antarctica]|uniref:ESAT-6-like protein n=1 Tax=Amycolatopsis antarctica TaxID=1854586 RepID=A0A263D1Q2_9PSEU|nr:WXG100 family type VII secretion target [Amycolatopsis antarctica]OZM72129.1 hypothetical protein CFN78_16450 [Amycolatopsis antarctica]
MPEASVSVPGMQQASERISDAASQLRGQLGQFQEAQVRLTSGLTGEAAEVFNGALNSWTSNYEQIQTALTRLQESMRNSIDTYTQTNNANVQAAQDAVQTMNASGGLAGL